MRAAKLLLAGGTYTNDFFETNPPLILYLYTPPAIAASLLPLKIAVVFRIYIFLLAAGSLYICNTLITKIFPPQDKVLGQLFLLATAFIFLILPVFEFGQREHLLLIFTMPYFLLVTYQLQQVSAAKHWTFTPLLHTKTINPYYAVLIGLLAGIGFAIKPYFIGTLIVIECYHLLYLRNLLAWIRSETLVIMGFMLLYLVIIFIFSPEYIYVIVPYTLRLYYAGVRAHSLPLLFNYQTAFCWFTLIFYVLQWRDNPYKIFSTVLLLGLTSLFFFTYFMQHMLLQYHLLPALAFSFLLLVFLFSLRATNPIPQKISSAFVFLIILVAWAFLYYFLTTIWSIDLFQSPLFYLFLAILFTIQIFIVQPKNSLIKVILAFGLIAGMYFLFTDKLQNTIWYPHQFFFTALIFTLFLLLLPPRMHKKNIQHLLIAPLAIFIFAYPYFLVTVLCQNAIERRALFSRFNQVMTHYAHQQPVYFLSTTGLFTFPGVDEVGVPSASRFPFFWMLPGLLRLERTIPPSQQTQLHKDRDFFIDMVAADLNKNKPYLVFIDNVKEKNLLHDINFDYLPYFLQNKNFQQAWQPYRYLITAYEYRKNTKNKIYSFQLYVRAGAEGTRTSSP